MFIVQAIPRDFPHSLSRTGFRLRAFTLDVMVRFGKLVPAWYVYFVTLFFWVELGEFAFSSVLGWQ
jgi:hypothetical protein